ncbi:bile acid/Na+ symporter family transporter [Klebsiella pneumoniae]|uniref:Bile acid/Na+ symporter family transporter n=1 Tax=Klebsiella pneumoniae TaxID=573 RepID=A0A3S4IM11_KLEPN|nr:bile acid/Na+ symporter family transporter [Klebsiella pneumoniae]
MKLFRILDPFTATLITVVLLASFFPARGAFVPFFEHLTTAAIALLFFMHGAKLSREAIIAGGSHWRLHLWVMCSTFILFPLLGVLFAWWAPVNVDPMLYSGFILSMHSAGHRAIRYRLYFAGRGQRRGCGLLSLGLQPAGDLCFPAYWWGS